MGEMVEEVETPCFFVLQTQEGCYMSSNSLFMSQKVKDRQSMAFMAIHEITNGIKPFNS